MTACPASVVVIGAGPAGLAAAHTLAAAGVPVRILEAAPHVGGLARSFDLWGQTVDVGPHRFFSTIPEVNALFRAILGDDYTLVNRLTRIYYRGRFFRYPLEIGDVIQNLGPVEIARSAASWAAARIAPPRPASTFEDWVTSRFGRRLFQMFFESYSEKLWGIPCSRIDAAWAAQRIRGFSLVEAAKGMISKAARRRHRTLADAFPYPRGGTGTLYIRLADRVRALGGAIDLGTPVEGVTLTQGDARAKVAGVRTRDGREIPATHVISTMPLTEMVRGLPGAPAAVLEACRALRYRNTIFVYLEIDHANVFPDNWIYVHAPDLAIGRITNFRTFCPSLRRGRPTTILCLERWCFDEDAVWAEPDDVIARDAERELRLTGLVPPGAASLGRHVLRVRRSYPVYEIGYRRHVETIGRHLDSIDGLFAVGRDGAFRYNNQDHAIHMGILAARAVTSGRGQALSADEGEHAYQEGARLADTGLSR